MAYYGNDEDYVEPSEPYGEDEGSELEQLIAQQEQELAMAEQHQQLEIEEKLLKNLLRAIFRDVSVSGATRLSGVPMLKHKSKMSPKAVVKRAKAFPNLKTEVRRINAVLNANKAKNASKLLSSSPMLFYILIGGLIIFIIIAVIASVGSVFSWLFPDEDGGDGGANSAFGITGADFYGARMVYTDNEKATQSIVEDYVEFVENGIVEAEQITTISAGGSDYSVKLNLNHIDTLGEDYDFNNFDESSFYSNHSKLYGIVLNIAKETYKIDNVNSEIKEYSGSSLVECIDGIKYFGFGNVETTATMVAEEIVTIDSITAKDGEGNTITHETTKGLIEDAIEQKLVQYYTSNTSTARAEKLFVKDYILEGEEARVSGVPKENYVAMIFMPRNDVTFTKLSFAVGNADLTNFEISMEGVNITTDGNNLGNDEKHSYIYGTGSINLSACEFKAIDENNSKALADGLSLFDIVENQDLNNSTYLETKTDDNSVQYFTLIKDGVIVEMQNDEPFSFVEYETSWQSAQ